MSELALPKIDHSIVDKKNEIVKKLSKLTNSENVLSEADELRPYETDALSVYTQTPLAVVLPENTKEVSEILKYCNSENIKVVPRGAGTGLSGGALPLQDAVLLGLGKFNKIFEIDYENKCVVTNPKLIYRHMQLSIRVFIMHQILQVNWHVQLVVMLLKILVVYIH